MTCDLHNVKCHLTSRSNFEKSVLIVGMKYSVLDKAKYIIDFLGQYVPPAPAVVQNEDSEL